MSDKRIEILRDMDTGKAVVKLAIPAIVGFMVMSIYNVADTVFVSWWDFRGAGAVQLLFPVMMIASSIGLTFGIGGGSYISRLLGKGDREMAKSVVSTSLFTALFVALLYVVIMISQLKKVIVFLGAKGDMISLSYDYGFYIVIGGIFVICSMVLNNALRAEGSAKYSMIGMGVGSIINIFLDPLFIFGFNLGLEGAALATMLSQAISFSILYQFYLRKKTLLELKISYFKFDLEIYKEVFKIGLPTLFRILLFSISMAMLNNAAFDADGDYLLSAMGIALKITSVLGFFVVGMGQGVQPVVGYNYGAGKMDRVLSASRQGMIKTFVWTLAGALVFIVFAKQIMFVFTKESEVVNYGIVCIRSMSAAIILNSISNTIAVMYQAMGHSKAAMFLSVLRQGILFIPLVIVLPKLFGINGVIFTQFFADVLAFIISFILYLPFIKREKRKMMAR